jgi:O-antigen ligase
VGGGFEIYKSASMWEQFGPEGARQRAIHSIYFRILGEQGFLGLVIFLSLLAASWRSCTKVRKMMKGMTEGKWAFDLASMLQVSLLAFVVAGLATTSSYFDLTYQLMALCVLLRLMVERSNEFLVTVRDKPQPTRGSAGSHPTTVAVSKWTG